jgi:biopolymer transport protein ExbD
MRTRAPLLLALCLLGCGSDTDAELMAGQVARVNRDLALLTERVDAVEKRLGAQAPALAGADTPPAPGSAPASTPASATTAAAALPSATLPDTLEVRIEEGGTVRIDSVPLAGQPLAARLADHAGKGPGARIAIHIAASTPPAQLAQVIDLARQSGIREISVLTAIP